MASRGIRAVLALILLAYLVLAGLFAMFTPAWQAPDEPAHYNYARYLAENGTFPVLHMGDYPHAYLEEIKSRRFPPEMSIDSIRYEFHQPPLYYALAAAVYSLTAGNLLALRWLSVLLGAGVVVLTYVAGRTAFPDRPRLALGAAAFVAFLPQHLATVSQVGNDVLAELLFAATLVVLLGGARRRLLLGLLLGLILITKTTAYIAIPLAGSVLLYQWIKGRASVRQIATDAVLVALPALLLAAPWYARNAWVYGWPDILGLVRHEDIVLGQTRTADFIAQYGFAAYWQRAFELTFKSFYAVFGWMGVLLDSRVYFALALLSGAAIAGGVSRLASRRRPDRDRSAGAAADRFVPPPSGLTLALSALFTLLVYIWYNLTFVQHQGRYLFTALIPIALAFAAGWDALRVRSVSRLVAALLVVLGAGLAVWGIAAGAGLPRWPLAITVAFAGAMLVRSYLPRRLDALVFTLPFLALVPLDLYALFGAIIPQLTR